MQTRLTQASGMASGGQVRPVAAERSQGDVAFLVLSGELVEGSTFRQGAILEHINRLIRSGKTLIVLDLANVTRVDAMGIGEIAEACVRVRAGGANLALLRPQPQVDRLLSITKLRTVIDVCDREDEIRPRPAHDSFDAVHASREQAGALQAS